MPANATCSSKPRRISPFSNGSMLVACEGATPSEPKGYVKSTVVFASCCPRISSGSKNRLPTERIRLVRGELRKRDIRVGGHLAISPGAVPRFLKRFEEIYGSIGRTELVISTAAAHHRLLWIHPFLDGNGRVARLMSHSMLLELLDTGAVWSVARGLARNVEQYKTHLANCDLTRRNDLDGRGTLSEEAIAEFTRFFLSVCIDQVSFMEGLVQPDRLRTRILLWAEEEIRLGSLPLKSGSILEAVLYRGELPRGDAATVVGTGERQAPPHCLGSGG